MKKVNVLIVSAVLILGLTNTVYSQEEKEANIEVGVKEEVNKIGVIDGRRIFDEYPESKKAKGLLVKELKEKQEEINTRTQEIEKLEEELKSNLLLSDEERAKKEKEINEKKRAVLKYSHEAEEYLSAKEEELTKEITQKVYLLIKQIAEEKGINIILENNYVLYVDDSLDITEDVIAKIKSMTKKEGQKEKETTPLKK
ncbi:MAG: OmpH family outer membrane protein [bacterium]